MKLALSLILLVSAWSAHADVLTCSDGAGHQIMISKADAEHLDGLACKSGNVSAHGAAASKPHFVAATKMDSEMRIAPATQKARDDDRRKILQDELQSEQTVLDGQIDRRKAATGGLRDNLELQIHRTEQNIAAINRELARESARIH